MKLLDAVKEFEKGVKAMNGPLNDEWIEWNGGKCPVEPNSIVEIKVRGFENKIGPAFNFLWVVDGTNGDITAYRIIKESQPDPVNHPSHYQLLPGVEVIDVRDAIFSKMPPDTPHDVADCWSRSWEYLTRMWGKNGLEDAKKARFYLDRMIKKMEGAE